MVKIRPIRSPDLSDVTELVGQLGYPSPQASVKKRLAVISKLQGHAVLVAQAPTGRVIGWIHAYPSVTLEGDLGARIGGLVVDASHRGQGVGKLLMGAVEKWSLKRGYRSISFSSRIQRKRGHKLYRRLGYKVIKTSHIFAKDLAGAVIR